MGRKIPGKKHRGVKDPYKQQEVRLNKVKHKLNAKPASTESQEIPRRLHDIAKFNNTIIKKDVNIKKKKKKLKDHTLIDGRKYVDRESEMPGMTRPTKMVPLLQQNPQENYKKFLKRVDRVTNEILKEAAFEKKFKVEVQRNEHGQVVSVQHEEKIDHFLSDKQKKNLVDQVEKKKVARRERDKRRRGKKRKADDDDDDEFSHYQDKFEFGEVNYEPPTLDTEKIARKINANGVKPKTFLFMEKLKEKQVESPSQEGKASSTSSKPNKKSAKGKISAGRQRIIENERLRVVEAYRSMKASKHHAHQPVT